MSWEEKDILKSIHDPKKKELFFSMAVKEFSERIYWHIRKMVLSHDDANDVLQNTLLKAWNGLDTFRGECKFSSWLYKIATNETITFLNSKRRQNIYGTEVDDISLLISNLESDSYFDGDELQMMLQKAILTLPDKQRLVFNMRYFDDLSYDEMEKILGTSVGALKASYHHAVKKIEKFISFRNVCVDN
jgi:RNA polymerase sigma-70 factor, ECF subfamily